MKRLNFYRNKYFIFLMDIMIFFLAWYGAHFIRFEFDPSQFRLQTALKLFPIVLMVKVAFFIFFQLYRGMWRYTSINDLLNIIKACFLSFLFLIVVVLWWNRFEDISRSVFIIDCGLTILMIGALRLAIRIYFFQFGTEKNIGKIISSGFGILKGKQGDFKRLIIIGAGNCGEKLLRELRENPLMKLKVVAFLDDNDSKQGLQIHTVPVLGTIDNLSDISARVNADEIIIAIPSANSNEMRRIVSVCQKSGLVFKTVPGYGEFLNGKVTYKDVREVAYRDLLGRDVVQLEGDKITRCLKDQAVMVTGAGGSIGSELCRQICKFMPSKLILFERAESPLYEIELELKTNFKHINIIPLLGDVQNKNDIDEAFKLYFPSVVYHAAAYKHVPMMEKFSWKAVLNNIIGTINMVEASIERDIDRFVMVSTDKAVRPTNVMGASKRVSEMVVQNYSCETKNTKFMTVRFGNVVGSVGSVVPLFKKQIARGGPVTVTHPDVTRFFMMIPEACQLILQAGTMGGGGEIYILDMGEPIKIDDMAKDLIRFSGFRPGFDIKIEYVGLRPGEKLFEELIAEGEDTIATKHDKIMVLNSNDCNMVLLNGYINQLKEAAENQDNKKIMEILIKIVPEYNPSI